MANGDESGFVHLLLWALGGLLSVLAAIGAWIMRGFGEKLQKHDTALYEPEGALRRGDHNVRNDLNSALLTLGAEMKRDRDRIAEQITKSHDSLAGKIEEDQKATAEIREELARAGFLRRRQD